MNTKLIELILFMIYLKLPKSKSTGMVTNVFLAIFATVAFIAIFYNVKSIELSQYMEYLN